MKIKMKKTFWRVKIKNEIICNHLDIGIKWKHRENWDENSGEICDDVNFVRTFYLRKFVNSKASHCQVIGE